MLGHIPIPLRYAVPLLEFGERNLSLGGQLYIDEKFYRLKESQIYMAEA